MKTFLQFITENTASQQAARLGLEGDGHGGWYDRTTGEFVAKTEKGRLKFYNKRQKVGGKDPAQTEKEKNISDPNFVDPKLQQQDPQQFPSDIVERNGFDRLTDYYNQEMKREDEKYQDLTLKKMDSMIMMLG